MSINIGVVMDPIEHINYKKDSTLAMLWAAQERGWTTHYMQPKDIYLDGDAVKCLSQPITNPKSPEHYYQLGKKVDQPLSDFDAILMRKDPPFDMDFIFCTYLLDIAESAGVLVVNKPQSLRDCNEKLFATQFPQCCPLFLVGSSAEKLREFHRKHGDIICKPLHGMGGSSIFRLKPEDPNISVIFETLTHFGKTAIMAQQYLPEIVDGDKRILMVDGEPIPYALARIPAKGETRGNLAAGGSGRAQPLSDRDFWIAEQVGPTLKQRGIVFAGLDVIGDYLTEINVTSPTCIREIDAAYDTDIAGKLMDCIETRLSAR